MNHGLFIYGSLAPGQPNEYILKRMGGEWETATINGHLRNEGWGAKMGFPAIELDEHGDEVNGFLFSSEKLNEQWEELDDFEGKEYQRVLATVQKSDGTTTLAYVYVLKK